ncbi:MAG: hypothetical protein WAM69_08285 [Candidatus Sulfotelmatobacter sp.]
MLDAVCFPERYILKGRISFPIGYKSLRFGCAVPVVLAFSASSVLAGSCLTSSEMDDATRTALATAGLRYFDLVAKGDAASLRRIALPVSRLQ